MVNIQNMGSPEKALKMGRVCGKVTTLMENPKAPQSQELYLLGLHLMFGQSLTNEQICEEGGLCAPLATLEVLGATCDRAVFTQWLRMSVCRPSLESPHMGTGKRASIFYYRVVCVKSVTRPFPFMGWLSREKQTK